MIYFDSEAAGPTVYRRCPSDTRRLRLNRSGVRADCTAGTLSRIPSLALRVGRQFPKELRTEPPAQQTPTANSANSSSASISTSSATTGTAGGAIGFRIGSRVLSKSVNRYCGNILLMRISMFVSCSPSSRQTNVKAKPRSPDSQRPVRPMRVHHSRRRIGECRN